IDERPLVGTSGPGDVSQRPSLARLREFKYRRAHEARPARTRVGRGAGRQWAQGAARGGGPAPRRARAAPPPRACWGGARGPGRAARDVGTRCGAARRAAAQVGERATLAHTAFKIVVDRLRRTLRARLAMHRSRRPEGDLVCTLYTDHEGKRRGSPVWI